MFCLYRATPEVTNKHYISCQSNYRGGGLVDRLTTDNGNVSQFTVFTNSDYLKILKGIIIFLNKRFSMCMLFCFILSSFQSRRYISNSSADARQQYFDLKKTIDNTSLNYIIGLQVVGNVCKIPLQKLTFLFR